MNSQDNEKKKFFIKTLGCKVNQYESQAMREILAGAGFDECPAEEMADIYIVNTCAVTHKADSESRRLVGLFHKANPRARIIVAGCYVEQGAAAIASLPGVAGVLKNKEKGRIAEFLSPAVRRTPYTVRGTRDALSSLTISGFKGHTKAFLKIQDGCGNSCSYCKVPLVRGPSTSRPITDIMKEAGTLIRNGFGEIVL